MRVDSAVVGMTGDQNISEKEKKMCRQKKHFHKHLTKKCNKQQTMNDAPRRLAKCTFPDFFSFYKSFSIRIRFLSASKIARSISYKRIEPKLFVQ